MAVEKLVRLYHGGKRDIIYDLMYGGARLSPEREFYCTTAKGLAQEASTIHGVEGALMEVIMTLEHFRFCVDCGIFEVREYCGVIQYEGASEVIVKPGDGIRIINEILPRELKPSSNFGGVERLLRKLKPAVGK